MSAGRLLTGGLGPFGGARYLVTLGLGTEGTAPARTGNASTLVPLFRPDRLARRPRREFGVAPLATLAALGEARCAFEPVPRTQPARTFAATGAAALGLSAQAATGRDNLIRREARRAALLAHLLKL